MKRILLTIAALALTVSFISFGVARAADMRTGKSVSVGKGEHIDASLYTAGSTVTVAGTVDGDLFCAGQNIEVTGTVHGDVLCAGQMVRINGTVEGDVRVAGQSVIVGGTVAGSLTAAGQTVSLDSGAQIGQDVSVFGSSLTLAGQVARDVVGAGKETTISGSVGRHIDAAGEALVLEDGAKVGGNIVYSSYNQPTVMPGATVAGTTERHDPPREAGKKEDGAAARYIVAPLYGFVSLLLIGLLGVVAAPRALQSTSSTLSSRPLASVGLGLMTLLATPLVSFMFIATIIGAPLGLVMLLLWILGVVAAFIITSYHIGELLVERLGWQQWRAVLSMTLGLLVLIIMCALPFIGGLVAFLAICWGFGAKVLWVYQGSALRRHKKTAKA